MSVDTDLTVEELEAYDFEVVEELDFEPPCDAMDCDVAAFWVRVTSCITDGCPDQTILLCAPHGEMLRSVESAARLRGDQISCTWCGTSEIRTDWTPLRPTP